MPLARLCAFLDANNVKYVTIRHSRAYTAQEVAASAHIPGREIAKTVMARMNGIMVMVVLPADSQIDFDVLREQLGAQTLELAPEADFKDLFPHCETGAMPPFGNLYGMDVYVAESLAEDEKIAFNAGSHTELIQMDYADFERLVQPTVLRFSTLVHA